MKKKTRNVLIGAGALTAITSIGVFIRKKLTQKDTKKYLMEYKEELEKEKTRK
jgi:hypothetical protein